MSNLETDKSPPTSPQQLSAPLGPQQQPQENAIAVGDPITTITTLQPLTNEMDTKESTTTILANKLEQEQQQEQEQDCMDEKESNTFQEQTLQTKQQQQQQQQQEEEEEQKQQQLQEQHKQTEEKHQQTEEKYQQTQEDDQQEQQQKTLHEQKQEQQQQHEQKQQEQQQHEQQQKEQLQYEQQQQHEQQQKEQLQYEQQQHEQQWQQNYLLHHQHLPHHEQQQEQKSFPSMLSSSTSSTSKHQFLFSMPITIKKITTPSIIQMGQNVVASSSSFPATTSTITSHSPVTTSTTTPLFRMHNAQKLYAKALYDNAADSPDELAFKKGDILTVIEQDTDGLVGWWLCTLRGRQGLCPGNRLRILNSYDSGCFSPSPASSPCPSLAASTATLNSSICSADIYENTSIISGSGSSGISGSSNASGSSSSSSGCGSSSISASQTQLNTTSNISNNSNNNNNLSQQQTQHQRHGTRRSWHVSPNKVITPQRHGDVYIYNLPPQQQSQSQQHQQQQQSQLHAQHHLSASFAQLHLQQQQQSLQQQSLQYHQQQQQHQHQQIYQNIPARQLSNEFENYDIPKPAVPIHNYDTPRNITRNMAHLQAGAMKACSTPIQEENYDVPRPLTSLLQHQHTLTPSSSNSSLLTSDSLSLSFSSSNRSSLVNMPDYDIPRRNPLPVRAVLQQQQQQVRPSSRASMNGNGSTYDFPLPTNGIEKNGLGENGASTKELPLELSSALETLAKLQSETTSAISRLLAFVCPDWRSRDKLEPVLMEVKLAAVRLRTALHDLAEFGEGALGNASKSEDRTLAQKLKPIIRALRDANKLVQDSCEVLEANGGWSLESIVRADDKNNCRPPDSLDRLIACAQTLTEDVRSTTSFIQGNASLLFKRQLTEVIEECVQQNSVPSSVPQTPTCGGGDPNSAEWLEDYDYVSFESKDAAARKNSVLREAIPENLKNKFDTVLKAAENTVLTTANSATSSPAANGKKPVAELTDKDKMLVRYYAVQISTHMGNLRQAIDSFLETVEKNQPPKFFIAYGKFVVVSAHNLVTIGDIVHRNVSKADLKEKILICTNNLADALKNCVLRSKQAAAHFPSVTAVQEMVDSVVDISHLACALKTVMLHAVQLTL